MLPLLTAALIAVSPATVEGSSDFAIDLYQHLSKADGNLFFSPYSISSALDLARAGARGDTAAQMSRVLHLGDEPLPALVPGQDYTLTTANRIFAQRGLKLLPDFVKTAPVEQLDFATAAEAARLHINDWVSSKTQQHIKELVPQGMMDSATRLVLANAIYFKSKWAHGFDKKSTQPMPFHLGPDKTVDVPMMTQALMARYRDSELGQQVELPYQGGDLSMVIFVPKQELRDAKLDRRLFDGSMSSMTEQEVHVWLPRFKLTNSLELSEPLRALGMNDAFTRAADFSGIDGRRDLSISAVVHKAFVDVNEEGTEAAAATGVVIRATAAIRTPELRADKPFVFAIRDNRTGALLFMGRVTDPRP
jgi:serpin B